jgi:hypothetical protein
MPADATIVSLRSDTAEAPVARRDCPREQPEQPPREQPGRPIERSSEPEKAPQSPRRRWVRWVSFALLPLALIAGAYWFVTGGRVMSTDDASLRNSSKHVLRSQDYSGNTIPRLIETMTSRWRRTMLELFSGAAGQNGLLEGE